MNFNMFTKSIFFVTGLFCFALPSLLHADDSEPADPAESISMLVQSQSSGSEKCVEHEFLYTGDGETKAERTPQIRNKFYEELIKAQREAEVGNFDRASAILDQLLEPGDLNSYELANLHNLYAFLHYQAEDYHAAIRSYQAVISQEKLPQDMVKNTIFTLSQVYMVTEDWCAGLDYLNQWFSLEPKPNAQSFQLAGQAYFINNQFDPAKKYFKRAMELEQSQENPNQSILMKSHLVLATIYSEENNYSDARINAEAAINNLESQPPSEGKESVQAGFHWFLAKAYKGLDEPAKAYQSIEKAIYLAGDDVSDEWYELREELRSTSNTQ